MKEQIRTIPCFSLITNESCTLSSKVSLVEKRVSNPQKGLDSIKVTALFEKELALKSGKVYSFSLYPRFDNLVVFDCTGMISDENNKTMHILSYEEVLLGKKNIRKVIGETNSTRVMDFNEDKEKK
jgi:hypothetical protein